MNKKRLLYLALLVAIFSVVAVGCGASPEEVAEPTDAVFTCEGKTMAYAGFGSQFAFIAVVDQSMKDAAEEAGVELVFLDNEFDPAKALENAEIIAARDDIDLVFEFNYYEQQNYVIKDIFEEAGIPVIAIDIPIPGAVYYGADNYDAGKQAGLGLAQAAQEKWGDSPVDLVLVEAQDMAGQQTLEQRTLGIIAGVKEGLPYLTDDQIIRFEGGVNVDEAAEAVATQLEANPESERVLVGMLGDSNAIAALNYTESSAQEILSAGIGGDEVGINALRTGEPEGFVGSTLFRPEQYGYDLIPLGCDLLEGKQIPPELFITHVFLNKDNLDEFYPEE